MTTIIWQALETLWYVPLLAGAIIGCLYRSLRVQRVVSFLSGPGNRTQQMRNWSLLRHVTRTILLVVGFITLFIALLRPSTHCESGMERQEGRDLFIALDISRSMLAQDCAPNRLEQAKKKIKQLVNTLDSERVGLILFSGAAIVQCPLTTDKRAFFMFLDQVDVETISSGTTALDQAVMKSLDAFSSGVAHKNKLLVICTDGEDFSSNLSHVKDRALKQQLYMYTLGIGTPEGAPIPLYDHQGVLTDHQRDAKGSVVITRLNDGILHTLARDSGGRYTRITEDTTDVKTIAQLVRTFEKMKIEEKKRPQLKDQYPYIALISFICFALEWII